ncbi:DUF7340 domain-containing protein [Gordonia alkaliphila]|uniref:Uncharacterized protein n=1 Tax=Gordonia alkaliphila TaxID=1053547 RepID=A0ABP8ZH16_9ACTN
MTNPDEHNLPGARKAFADAVHALAGRTSTTFTRDDGTPDIVFGDPLLDQLADRVTGTQGAGGTRGHAGSKAPIVIDAVDLLATIRRTITSWIPSGNLHVLAEQPWRPQDVPLLTERTRLIHTWTNKARSLLDPPRRWTIPAPCPACGTATVYRQDGAGDTVRQPALQIGPDGCQCQHCLHTWAPEYFAHLARTLGTLPANVLE